MKRFTTKILERCILSMVKRLWASVPAKSNSSNLSLMNSLKKDIGLITKRSICKVLSTTSKAIKECRSLRQKKYTFISLTPKISSQHSKMWCTTSWAAVKWCSEAKRATALHTKQISSHLTYTVGNLDMIIVLMSFKKTLMARRASKFRPWMHFWLVMLT